MFMENIKLVRLSNAVAAGTTAIEAAAVDRDGYDGVAFVVLFGAIVTGATTSVKAQSCTAADGSNASDLEGSNVTIADSDDNKIAYLEINRPTSRFLRPYISRGAQNATVDGVFAILFNGRAKPALLDATVVAASKILSSPANGTA